jgi:hypothetical protein
VQDGFADQLCFFRVLLLDMKLKSYLDIEEDRNWAFVPGGCGALLSRIQTNFKTVRQIASLHFALHSTARLLPLAEEALAKEP